MRTGRESGPRWRGPGRGLAFGLAAVSVSALLAVAGGCATGDDAAAPKDEPEARLRPSVEGDPIATEQPRGRAFGAAGLTGPEAGTLGYKTQRKREAMRGLTYDTGRVLIDEKVAPEIAEPGTREEALALYDEANRVLFQENRGLDAIKLLTRAIIMQPSEAILYTGLGNALFGEKEDAKALAAFETAVDVDPRLVEGWRGLGDAAVRVGDRRRGVEAWRTALELEPTDANITWRLAVQEYYLGNLGEAWDLAMEAERLGEAAPPQFIEHLNEALQEQADRTANNREEGR